MVVKETKIKETKVYFYDDFIIKDAKAVEAILNEIANSFFKIN